MNRDDIHRMANEAAVGEPAEFFERFARLIAAAEREACARIVDGEMWNCSMLMDKAAWNIAVAIRARGEA